MLLVMPGEYYEIVLLKNTSGTNTYPQNAVKSWVEYQ